MGRQRHGGPSSQQYKIRELPGSGRGAQHQEPKGKGTGEKCSKTVDDASTVEVEAVSENDSDGDADVDWDFDESLLDALMVRTAVEEAAEC